MSLKNHIKLLAMVTVAWVLFWVAGLPDYYQQYATVTMVVFDLAILPPIWLIIYRSVQKARPGRAVAVSWWWAFYIAFLLFLYDLLYVGLFLGHGMSFLWKYWYLTVYYVLPWLVFPPTGRLIEKRRRAVAWEGPDGGNGQGQSGR